MQIILISKKKQKQHETKSLISHFKIVKLNFQPLPNSKLRTYTRSQKYSLSKRLFSFLMNLVFGKEMMMIFSELYDDFIKSIRGKERRTKNICTHKFLFVTNEIFTNSRQLTEALWLILFRISHHRFSNE